MSDRISAFLSEVNKHPSLRDILVLNKRLAGNPAVYDEEIRLLPPIQTALRKQGIERLYKHQADSLRAYRSGKNVVVATPTASGKTLTYFIPALEAALTAKKHSLFLYPLKALENDQLKKWNGLTEELPATQLPRAGIYDGDTPDALRRTMRRDPPEALFTTPDMLHLAILPFHSLWSKFFANLELVVVDELHTYRGLFGTHMAWVFRRLQRICAHYGAKPKFLATSATIANPGKLGELLFEGETVAITESGAPRSPRNVLMFNPDSTSAFSETARLFQIAAANDLRTLVFTRSRSETERMYMAVAQKNPALAAKISAYRSGYLPEERREIEQKLASGELKGVISTNALELGIDIGGLDVCVLSGFPGLISQTWQRWGRVGRGEDESVVILVASPNALDQYLLRYPEELFTRPFESANINRSNTFVADSHLLCAAQELPLALSEPWLQDTVIRERMDGKIATGELLESAEGGQWFAQRPNPQRGVDLRSAGSQFSIVDKDSGRTIGSISGNSIFRECHPNAIYLHNGKTFIVDTLDPSTSVITASEPNPSPSYYTMPRSDKATEILQELAVRESGSVNIRYGRLRVHETVTGYEKRNRDSRQLEGVYPLEMPETVFETYGCWIEMPATWVTDWSTNGHHFPGSRHATEHAMLALLPLIALCDRNDVGGITMDMHPQTKCPTIFLYDGFNGGAGLTETGFQQWDQWLDRTIQLVKECPCTDPDGCPSCIQSPKCGSGNRPLDKAGAVALLERLRTGEATVSLPTITEAPLLELETISTANPIRLEETSIVYFDIETLRSADDVGGWGNIYMMGIALAVVFDERTQAYTTYYERDVEALVKHLASAELVIGYNILRFDYDVIRGYGHREYEKWPSFDMLVEVQQRFGGRRLPLSALAKATLNDNKSADGLQSLQWVKEGKWDLIEQYCQHDVKLTRDLFKFALENGFLLTDNKKGDRLRITVDWKLEKLLTRRN